LYQRVPAISTELPFLTEWRRGHCPNSRPSPQTAEGRCPCDGAVVCSSLES
jgi:hypothetical protein